MNKAEQNAYSRGYNAGRKRNEREEAKWKRIHEDISSEQRRKYEVEQREIKEQRVQVFCAALQGIIMNGTWHHGGKPATSVEHHVYIAEHFMKSAIQKKIIR